MAFTVLGDSPVREVIHKHESHKLHQAFNVVAGQTINQGDMCYLMPSGEIQAWKTGAAPAGVLIGIAVTDSVNPAYKATNNFPIEVTVAVKGYIVLWGEASAAIAAAGPVAPAGRSANDLMGKWITSADATGAVALFPVSAGELVQILVLN